MKLKKGLMIHQTPDGHVAVATGESARTFNGMLRLSDTAVFIVRQLQNETTVEDVANAIVAEYDVDIERARTDVAALVEQLTNAGLMA